MAVSNLTYKIIKNAVKIRLDRQEGTLENLVAIYTKLSPEQAAQLIEELKNYQPQVKEDN